MLFFSLQSNDIIFKISRLHYILAAAIVMLIHVHVYVCKWSPFVAIVVRRSLLNCVAQSYLQKLVNNTQLDCVFCVKKLFEQEKKRF